MDIGAVIVGAGCGWGDRKTGQFPEKQANRALMMGLGAYLRVLDLAAGADALGRRR